MGATSHLPPSVAIVSNSDESLYRFHNPIMKALVHAGLKVYAVSPSGPFVADIENLGVEFVPWLLSRRSLNPFTEFASLVRLVRIYRNLRPQIVQHFTVKPNVYGAIAARLAGIPVVFSGVQGLGYAFGEGDGMRAVLRVVLSMLYKLTALLSDRFVLLNSHDLERLFNEKSKFRYKAMVVKGGVGVNLKEYSADAVPEERALAFREALGIHQKAQVVTMAARLLYDKGVSEYVEAAAAVCKTRPDTVFVLAGSPDPENPASVTFKDLEVWEERGSVRVAGHVEDMPALLAASDIVVLPSYSEGIPRVLIEAAAMSRAIVSTTIPGVAEIVEDGVNGILVPPKDADALATAIEDLLDTPGLRAEYGSGRPTEGGTRVRRPRSGPEVRRGVSESVEEGSLSLRAERVLA